MCFIVPRPAANVRVKPGFRTPSQIDNQKAPCPKPNQWTFPRSSSSSTARCPCSSSALQYLLAAGGGRGTHAVAVGEELWRYAQAEFSESYTRMLWMGLRAKAAYLPGC